MERTREIKVTHEQSRVQDEVALRQGLLDGTYKSRRLKLAHLSEQVKKTLAPAGINMFIDIQPDLKRALASF